MALPTLTATGAWLWEKFGDDVTSTIKGAAKQAWTGINWFVAAKRYRENLYEQYNRIQIFGQPEAVLLEGLFTHLNILDRPSALARYDIEALKKAVRKDPSQFHKVEQQLKLSRVEQIDGLELVRQPNNDRLFILGKPGAGKTTFLKYLTLQAVQGQIDAIPIFVSLKEWADSTNSNDLLAFLASRFDVCDFPNADSFVEFILCEGKALVLFDGLDEVDRETRERMRLIPTVIDFCTKYRESQCLITCRTAATDYTFTGFKYVEVADFNEGQMHIFVRKWFKNDAAIRDKFWDEFNKVEHRGLRELGRIPLLLTLLCLAYQETLSFPKRRVEIYEEALDALLKKWDSSRKIARDVAYRKLSIGRKRQMFARIAAETFDQREYFFRQVDLEKRIIDYLKLLPPADQEEDIDGTAVLKAIEAQHSIFVERADRIYAFAHLTFQEYFTAKYVMDNAREGTIPRLLSHCTDDRWREIILLTASLLDKADDFFDVFRCSINSLIEADDSLIAFVRWVANKSASAQTDYKVAAVRGFYFFLATSLNRTLDRAQVRDFALNLAHARAFAFDLDHALDLNLDLDQIRDRDLALELDLARNLALNLDFDLDRTLNRALARDLACVLALDLDRALDRALARTLDLARTLALNLDRGFARNPALDFDRALDYELDLDFDFDRALDRDLPFDPDCDLDRTPDLARALALDLIRVLGLARGLARDLAHDRDPNLHQALITLGVPVTDTPPEAWSSFADELRSIMITHRNIGHEWNFAPEQIERLNTYFEANRLLVECLNLACVSNRAAIEDSLLLPPDI
jgi:hypothetical protein